MRLVVVAEAEEVPDRHQKLQYVEVVLRVVLAEAAVAD